MARRKPNKDKKRQQRQRKRQEKRRRERKVQQSARSPGDEWIVGRMPGPFLVDDEDGSPYRPDFILVVDASTELVLGQGVVSPEDDESLVDVVLETMERPMAGPPRRPRRLRVASHELAAELEVGLGSSLEVVVGPTPILYDILSSLAGMGAEREPSYLGDGEVEPQTVARLFEAAAGLFGVAPWKMANDGQILRCDIPQLEVNGGCISIVGQLDESLGILLFPSLDHYLAFQDAAEDFEKGSREEVVWSCDFWSLSFEPGGDLPTAMRRETARHGWPVAAANAYPLAMRLVEGLSTSLSTLDYRILTACASGVARFCTEHPTIFEEELDDVVSETLLLEDGHEVTISAPYRSGPEVALALHAHGLEITGHLAGFAHERFGEQWSKFARDFTDLESAIELAAPWSVYHYLLDGRPAFAWYLEEAEDLEPIEETLIKAQARGWLSIWQVIDVSPGSSLTLRDALSGETRLVTDARASESLSEGDAVLARMVDFEMGELGLSLICGLHSRLLRGHSLGTAVKRARKRLGRKSAVPIDRLRDEKFGRFLIKLWEELAEISTLSRPQKLRTTTGDPLLFTVDHFSIEPGAHVDIKKQLESLADDEAPAGKDTAYVFLDKTTGSKGARGATLIGQATLSKSSLRVDTMSIARADHLRQCIETACGASLQHRAREHSDPLSESALPPGTEPRSAEAQPESSKEEQQLLFDLKAEHYSDWSDHPLPALDGLTPRQAMGDEAQRDRLQILLETMEDAESSLPDGERFDFSLIRKDLGLQGRK